MSTVSHPKRWETVLFKSSGRSTDASYKYGFNGKETDPETGIQDYGMRWYLPNIARFPSVDPLTKKFPMLTPYQFASNTPIAAIDLDGAESLVITNQQTGWATVRRRTVARNDPYSIKI